MGERIQEESQWLMLKNVGVNEKVMHDGGDGRLERRDLQREEELEKEANDFFSEHQVHVGTTS